ncbi:hypothetical protein Mp_4g03840 [Marchantia polymorpha subsp. ruderalis]|nr:hypothetical protein MARPO_0044s0090 [Marchantia polymorpha]BBN07437.1 hypothetical protein Mp_4g03840 [Marchantia polymorpha subsp. ruderalis]|eukprot:PTQ39665.1 hypothetical protein MARPO_0044s0090 [Marchantia polymorpha]
MAGGQAAVALPKYIVRGSWCSEMLTIVRTINSARFFVSIFVPEDSKLEFVVRKGRSVNSSPAFQKLGSGITPMPTQPSYRSMHHTSTTSGLATKL